MSPATVRDGDGRSRARAALTRAPFARAVLAGCARAGVYGGRGGARQHDAERLRRDVPLGGARLLCGDRTTTKSRGALLPRDTVVRRALSLSVSVPLEVVIFTSVCVLFM